MPNHAPWPDALVDRLKQLADGTRSAGEIASIMGVSRNTIIGKVARLRALDPSIVTLSDSQGGMYRPWSPEDLIELARRVYIGERPYMIARHLDRRSRAVWTKIEVLRAADRRWPHSVIEPAASPKGIAIDPAKPATVCAAAGCRHPRQRGYPDGLCASCRTELMPTRLRAPSPYAVPGF